MASSTSSIKSSSIITTIDPQENYKPVKDGFRIHQILKDDTISQSFQYLQLSEIATCMKVCKYFCEISRDPLLWRHVSIRYGVQYVENQNLITLTQKAVVEIRSFNAHFLNADELYRAIPASQNQGLLASSQKVTTAVKNQDVLKIKEALIQFYSACYDFSEGAAFETIFFETINNFCLGKDSLQNLTILLKSQMRFHAGSLLIALAQGGETDSVRLLLSTPDLNFGSEELGPRYYINMAKNFAKNEAIRTLIRAYIDQHFREEEAPHFAIVPPAPGQGIGVVLQQNAPAVVQAPPAPAPAPALAAAPQFVPMEVDQEQTLQDD